MSIAWHGERRHISELNPAPYNPRRMTEKQTEDLGQSLARFGLAEPIVINLNNTIIGGHQRIKVLVAQGIDGVDVMVPDRLLTAEEEKELNLRLNKNVGEWDLEALANFSADLLKDVGFDSADLDHIFTAEVPGQDDVPEKPAEAVARPGDLYLLGEHRLLCGDATKMDDLAMLMGGGRAQMVFTDPPYNVNYTGGVGGDGVVHRRRSIKNDKMSSAAFYAFLRDVFTGLISFTDGAFYICMSSSELHNCWKAFVDCGGHWQTYIIWAKDTFTLSRADYHHQFEPILYGLSETVEERDGEPIMYGWTKHEWYGGRKQGDVWMIDRPKKSPEHPTMKPVALCERAIYNSSRRGEVVLDAFGGSGSTLIACEKARRRCYMMELDPIYMDVIIQRWERFTNQKAVRA